MDLEILHQLETFREGAGAFLNGFFYQITTLFDKDMIPLMLAAIYWCLSKQFGTYLLMGYHWNRLVNGFAKVTACAYRPWIKDPTLIPDSASLPGATGYSFPSGHSMNASTIFGGIGVRRDMDRWLRVAAWFIVALAGFSRLYMCVHTPQDVLVGILMGSIVMYAAYRLMPRITAARNGDLITAGISLLLAVLIAVYAAVKGYPTDYDAEGKVLVDGASMAVDTFKGVGWNCGFFIGWIIERRYVNFTSDGTLSRKVLRFVCGIFGYYFVNYSLVPLVKSGIGGTAGTIAGCFVQMLYIVLLYPACVRLVQKHSHAADAALRQ